MHASFDICDNAAVRGVATSGWQGRSHSFGIADAVTVLAANAACADAAATRIANAVDVGHPAIRRRSACELDEQTDLGDRAVTVDVPMLPADALDAALDAGAVLARAMVQSGVIDSAALVAQGRWRTLGSAGAYFKGNAQ